MAFEDLSVVRINQYMSPISVYLVTMKKLFSKYTIYRGDIFDPAEIEVILIYI